MVRGSAFCVSRRLLHLCLSLSIPRFSFHPYIGLIVSSSKRTMSDLPRSSLEPRVFPSSGLTSIEPSMLIEEELLPNYKAEKFYPVRIGEVFN